MAAAAAPSSSPFSTTPALPGRRYDRAFFTSTAVLMLAAVVVGFGPTYFYAGVVRAPLPSPLIHIHAAAFSLWIALLIVQTGLISARKVSLHRTLGLGGMVLGALMIPLGLVAATESLVRRLIHAPFDGLAFYLVPVTDLSVFGTLLFLAYRRRKDPAAHKRYIYLATTALLIAAFARFPAPLGRQGVRVAGLESDIFVVALFAYDYFSTRRIHRATLWGSAFLLLVQNLRHPLAETAAWHHVAGWIQVHAARFV